MVFRKRYGFMLLGLGLLPGVALGQAFPPQPEPRQGTILDVSKDPVLGAMPVTRLTVDVDQVPSQEAARAVKSGAVSVTLNKGPFAEMEGQVATLHVKDVPFMEGVMELRQQLRARISDSTGSVVTMIYQPAEEVPPWCVAGPFVVSYFGMSNEVQVPFDVKARAPKAVPPERHAWLRLDLAAEPGVTIMQAMQDVQCPGLEDDKHQAIKVGPAKSRGIITAHPTELELTLPEVPGRKIPLLKGTVDAKVGTTVAVDLASVTAAQTATAEGMTIETSAMAPRNGSTTFNEMEIKYTRGAMSPEKWEEVRPLLGSAKLKVAATGRGGTITASAMAGRDAVVLTGETVTVKYNVTVAQGAGGPGRATLSVPVGVTEVRVPFEFKDVVIP